MLLALTAAFIATAAAAQPPALSKGFTHFYNLEYDEAVREFEQEVAANPQDPNAHNHLAQGLLYREMLRAGALESELVSRNSPFVRRPNMNTPPEIAKRFDDQIARSFAICEPRLQQNPKDTVAMYALGVAYGLRANFNFLVRRAWMDSLRDATSARKLHNQVSELEPNNVDARLVQGVHDYLVGSLPWHYKILGFLTGFRGDREQGIKTLQFVAARGNTNRFDAQVLLAAIYRRDKNAELAIPLLTSLITQFPRNYLFRLELALMHQDIGENERAIAILDHAAEMKRSGAAGFRALALEKVYYYKGNVYFWSNELDRALTEYRNSTAGGHRLDLNSEVLAWMRTGQILDLKGNRQAALEAYKKAIALAPESGPGRESRGYLSSPYRRG